MITKHFTKVAVKFDPFAASAKPVRLFLARVPSQQKSGCVVDFKVLSNNEKPSVSVTFKDKHVMQADPEEMTFQDLSEYFDLHSRALDLKAAISD